MSQSIAQPRYAHAEGYTAVAFGKNGQFVCTGGSDSLVRVFHASRAERDQEAITLEQHSDNVLALAVSQGKVVSGDEEGLVYNFDLGTSLATASDELAVEPAGTVLRSTLPARDISISSNEKRVAIATDEDTVKVVSLLDMALLHAISGHRGSVNSVSFSPDATYLASADCSGTIRLWDMRDSEPTCVQIMTKMAYVCEPGNSMQQYKIRWSPNGRTLAVPCADHSIKLVKRGDWDTSASLSGKHTNMVTHMAWSSNSRYLATIGLDNQVIVWDVAARKSILTHSIPNSPCQIDWNPRGNMLAFADSMGAMYIWDNVVPIEQGHVPPFDTTPSKNSNTARSPAAPTAADAANQQLMSDLFDDSAAVDRTIGDDGAMDEDDIEEANGDNDVNGQGGDDMNEEEYGDDLDDFVVDDDGAGYVEDQTPRWMAVGNPETNSFQPGATPWINSRRYLAFNMIGTVVSIAQDESYNTVEIEFYDKSIHRDFHFSDSYKFSMAALSESGCLLATTSREFANDQSLRAAASDADEVSVVSYRGFSSWSTSTDWMVKLPEKEHPRCIAVSTHGAAVITSSGMLRLFTCGGVQRHIESLPNRVVTCVARNDLLLVVFEALGTLKSSTGLKRLEYEYALLTIDGQSRLAKGSCPMTPGSEIVWAGFSEEGHPAICDSKGMLRVLHKYWAGKDAASWVPILDTRKLSRERAKKEAFWPVAISARQFIVVSCRNKTKFPPFPKPILDELDVELPLLNLDSQVGQQESKYLDGRIFIEQQRGEAERLGNSPDAILVREGLEQDKMLLRLIQLACKADKTQRALDLAMMIEQEKSFDAAIKIAVFQKQSSLAERLMRYRETRFAGEDKDGDNELSENGEESMDNSAFGRPQPRRERKVTTTYGGAKNQESNDDGYEEEELEVAPPLSPPIVPRSAAATTAVSKPFNPFGVATPNKAMDIKRSDSFFKAADQQHSNGSSSLDNPGKRQSGEGDSRNMSTSRKQSRLSSFAFNNSGDDDTAEDTEMRDTE